MEKTHRSFEIRVVKIDGELLFQSGDLCFDYFPAYEEFEGGRLIIKRDGVIFDETSDIREYGTHAACTCFCGLKNVFGRDHSSSYAISAFVPTTFAEGDVLILEIDVPAEFDLVKFLREIYLFRIGVKRAFDKRPEGIELRELGRAASEEAQDIASDVRSANILRFGKEP